MSQNGTAQSATVKPAATALRATSSSTVSSESASSVPSSSLPVSTSTKKNCSSWPKSLVAVTGFETTWRNEPKAMKPCATVATPADAAARSSVRCQSRLRGTSAKHASTTPPNAAAIATLRSIDAIGTP